MNEANTIGPAGDSMEWQQAVGPLKTRWAKDVSPSNALPEYPRPQLVREEWLNLNGLWDVTLGDGTVARILVPYPVESALSGVMKHSDRLTYRRSFEIPKGWSGRHVMLHFGAVDWEATVSLNGKLLGVHRGGYDGFSFDITTALKTEGPQEIVVEVFDPTDLGGQPRGKQKLKPGSIMYTSTTGIWQTVWLEPVAEAHIESLKMVTDVDSSCLRLTVAGTGSVDVLASDGGKPVARVSGEAGSELVLALPDPTLWSPDCPHLYDLHVSLKSDGKVVDAVTSYFGMRKIGLGKDKKGVTSLMLNGACVFQVGPLDQGFWPDGLYTAPTDEALRWDVEETKRLGFNTTRKHIKVEPSRWYYWCDKLGLLVWQDMPSGNSYTELKQPIDEPQFKKELLSMVTNYWNHPSIIMWVVFNEGQGQHETEALVAEVKALDPSRLVNNASGNHDKNCGDVIDKHTYPGPDSPEPEENRAAVLGEFGGLGLPLEGHTWSEKTWDYEGTKSIEELTSGYERLLTKCWELKAEVGLAAVIYTQLTDVETECNGLITYDREINKVIPGRAAAANAGEQTNSSTSSAAPGASALDTSTVMLFSEPATCFEQSLPLGNGRIGAMVFGGVNEERIILNESSMWSGSPADNDRENAYASLPEIRRLLAEGNNAEASKLVMEHFTCEGAGSGGGCGANVPFGCYQTLGNLRLTFGVDQGEESDPPAYSRRLNLASSVAEISYTQSGIRFNREHYVSAPDEVFVSRFSANCAASLSFTVAMDRPERFHTVATNDHELLMTGTLNDGRNGEGVHYAARLRVLATGGSVAQEGDRLVIEKADEVILLFAAATDFQGFAGRQLTDPVAATLTDLDSAAAKPSIELLAAHKADYAKWFNRVSLQLGSCTASANASLPMDNRLVGFAKGAADPELATLYFNFGRYLLISSSRPGGLPANLQGLWAEEIQTPWNGDWHLDINVQMNYWPAQVCNLSELQEPLNKLIVSLVEPGRKTAKAYYGSRGWVAHVITNPWGFTAPGEHASWGATTGGSAWLCEHLWTQYAYTGDREFLAWAYPIMTDNALFYLDNIWEEPEHRRLVTGPSNSPENTFQLPDGHVDSVCMGPTIDMQQLRELFGNTTRAAELLDVDEELRDELMEKSARLAPNQIGPDGRLQEWLEPYAEPEPHHRHVSPLYGLHPYDEITPEGTPELAVAARNLLEQRGDEGTGWSLAWKINFWARLRDGDRAHKLLEMLLRPVSSAEMQYEGGGGSSDNLFCFHPPFQIDGNFGGCAGIAEMLLQSRGDDVPVIILLPALPTAWPEGSVKGMRTRGGFEVDMVWQGGALVSAIIRSITGARCKVCYGQKIADLSFTQGQVREITG